MCAERSLSGHRRQVLLGLGVAAGRIYTGCGLTGVRLPGLDQALAAVHAGDTLIVPRLDRFARSVPDARQIGDSLNDPGQGAAGGDAR